MGFWFELLWSSKSAPKSILGAPKIDPGGSKIEFRRLQNGLLEASAEIVAGRLCGPPFRGGKRVSGRTLWELLLQRTLEACETMKHGSKINMFGAP